MKSYTIQNIKSFKDETAINVKPITIFVGKNSCGKSSLIRFPVVVSQSMLSDTDAPLTFFGKSIDYGNYEDVVFGHLKRGKMNFSLTYDCYPSRFKYMSNFRENTFLSKKDGKTLEAKIDVGLARYSKRMIVDSFQLKIDGRIALEISRNQKENYYTKFYDFRDQNRTITCASRLHFFKYLPLIDVNGMTDQIIKAYRDQHNNVDFSSYDIKAIKRSIYRGDCESLYIDDDEKLVAVGEIKDFCMLIDYYMLVIWGIRASANQDADNTYYIGPFRENPSRVYREAEYQVDSVGARGEDVSTMLKNDFTHGKHIIKGVSSWFEKSMNYSLSLKDIGSGLYNIVVQKSDGVFDNLIDVGYGISQVLPIVTQLVKMNLKPYNRKYYSPYTGIIKSTFVIEQPELHLHPGAQAELANLFVDVVSQNNNDKNINILIETHSEHLIRRLQALIADRNVSISNEDVIIYYVDKNEKNEAYVNEMKILPNGQFEKEWPSGFFDKAYELSMELLKNNFN